MADGEKNSLAGYRITYFPGEKAFIAKPADEGSNGAGESAGSSY